MKEVTDFFAAILLEVSSVVIWM